jgi:hypothetical protein
MASMVSEAVAKYRSLRTPGVSPRLPLHPSGCPGQQHPVVGQAQDLRDPVRSNLVDNEMAGLAYPVFRCHQPPR